MFIPTSPVRVPKFLPTIYLMNPRRSYQFAKRAFDVAFSCLLLVALSPVLLITTILVAVSMGFPILYRAERVKQGGSSFTMLKFRTMVQNAERLGPVITAASDPRITPLGAILRKTKIDELPQLINVLKGEMSFVGPRPNVPIIVSCYSGDEMQLLNVPQGITDLSSLWLRGQEFLLEGTDDVMQDYENRVAPIKIRLGLYYVFHANFWLDLKIIVATATAIILRQDPVWSFPKEAVADTLYLVNQMVSENSRAA